MIQDKSRKIFITGIIICLVLITWTIMSWPLGLYDLKFWIFIFIALFEAILVVVINELLKTKQKKKKRDNKKLQKQFNTLLIVAFVVGILLIISLSSIIWILTSLNNISKAYPEGTMTYELEEYDKELIIPSYSVIEGEYWDELVVFRSPKSTDQLESELSTILNSSPFIKYETENGNVYYNRDEDYTITSYEVHKNLFMNSFNLVYCDGLCD